MHTTSSRARPVEFMSADARHVIASSQAGPWGPSRPFPALPGASRSPENCNVHRIWIDPMSISIQYQSFHKLWIWIDMDWSEPNLVLLWQNMANKQRLAGVLYLSHPPNPWPMQITQWDVLPMTIPMLGHRTVGPTLRPHLDFTKRFP